MCITKYLKSCADISNIFHTESLYNFIIIIIVNQLSKLQWACNRIVLISLHRWIFLHLITSYECIYSTIDFWLLYFPVFMIQSCTVGAALLQRRCGNLFRIKDFGGQSKRKVLIGLLKGWMSEVGIEVNSFGVERGLKTRRLSAC